MPPEKKPLMAYIPDSEFSYEEQENTIDDLRKEILREINYYHDSNGKDSGSDKSASTDYEKNIQTHNLTTVSSGVMHDFNEEKDDGNIGNN
jgi:predicted ATPase